MRAVGLRLGLSVDPYWDVLLTSVRQLEGGITATMHLDSVAGVVSFLAAVAEQWGGIDILVNNAGGRRRSPASPFSSPRTTPRT